MASNRGLKAVRDLLVLSYFDDLMDDECFKAIFHWAEFSARNDIFFCLLTLTLRQLVLNKRKCRSARKILPSGKWPLR